MMVTIKTKLNCSFEQVIELLSKSSTLKYVSAPILKFVLTDDNDFPEFWDDGNYTVNLKLFNIIDLGKQSIAIENIKKDNWEYILRDKGTGELAKTWDHWVYVNRTSQKDCTDYKDRVEVKSGIFTIFIWVFAQCFYRWRQKKWKILIKNTPF